MQMDNIIHLRSVYGKVGQTYFLQPVIDPKTGRFPDCVRKVDSKGDMILSDEDKNSGKPLIPENRVFTIKDGDTFDLNDPWKKAEWESIKNSPIIAPSRDARDARGNLLIDGAKAEGRIAQMRARYGVAELYVETPGVEVAAKVNMKRKIHDAETYIFEDQKGAEGRALRAKLLGREMKNAPDSEVMNFLLQIANKDPQKIIDLYTGTDTNLRLLFIEAKERKVIIVKNKVYMYGNVVLGTTDDSVIEFFKVPKNAKLVELITRDTYPEMYPEEEEEKPKKEEQPKK